VTSANLHGAKPATTADEVLAIFGGTAIAGILDGGTRDGEVSSVVDVSGDTPVIARASAVRRDAILAVLKEG
jgi:tRNA A37 threonylcarbamoyladenosine synthetase subunit TsaC/SUA5/YrdC